MFELAEGFTWEGSRAIIGFDRYPGGALAGGELLSRAGFTLIPADDSISKWPITSDAG
ncbi:MAG: hypothetical protein Kow0063_39090 [Anaerolineae bacterium]